MAREFVRDSMTGTGYANLDIGHSAETGGPWVRNGASPDTRWYLYNDRCHCGALGAVYASGSPSSADYYVECDYVIFSDIQGAGIALRMTTSALTFYGVRYQSGQYILSKFTAGSEAWLGTPWAPSPAHTGTHKLRITVSGSSTTTIAVAVDGVTVITYADSSSPITAPGKAGMYHLFGTGNDVSSGKHVDNYVAVDQSSASAARNMVFGVIG